MDPGRWPWPMRRPWWRAARLRLRLWFGKRLVAETEVWENILFIYSSLTFNFIWFIDLIVCGSGDWSNLYWVLIMFVFVFFNELLVLDLFLWFHSIVLVFILLVDELVINHVGKVLKTVELDGIMVVVNYMRIIAATTSAR